MKCRLRYTHPVTGNTFYFVDFRSKSGLLIPIGCFPYHKQNATIFQTKRDALKVLKYLISLGYTRVSVVF